MSRTAATSTIPVGALRDVVVNHLMQVVAATAMEAPAGGDPETLKDAQTALFKAVVTADPAHYVRGQYDGYRSIDGCRRRLDDRDLRGVCGSTSRTGAGRACRSSSAPASGCRSPRPSCGSCSRSRRDLGFGLRDAVVGTGPDRHQARSLHRHPLRARSAAGRIRAPPGRSSSTWSSPSKAARAPRPTRCSSTRRWSARPCDSHAQDTVEEAWRIMQPLLDAPPPVHAYAPGLLGARRRVAAGGRSRSLA